MGGIRAPREGYWLARYNSVEVTDARLARPIESEWDGATSDHLLVRVKER
jgi:hypothetical protein